MSNEKLRFASHALEALYLAAVDVHAVGAIDDNMLAQIKEQAVVPPLILDPNASVLRRMVERVKYVRLNGVRMRLSDEYAEAMVKSVLEELSSPTEDLQEDVNTSISIGDSASRVLSQMVEHILDGGT